MCVATATTSPRWFVAVTSAIVFPRIGRFFGDDLIGHRHGVAHVHRFHEADAVIAVRDDGTV